MVDRGPDGQMWLTVDYLETGRKNFSKATKMEFRVKTQGKKLPEFSLNTSDFKHIQSKIFENSRFLFKGPTASKANIFCGFGEDVEK